VGIAMAALFGSFMLFPFIGSGFFPDTDESQFPIPFETPEGASLAYTQTRAVVLLCTLASREGVDSTKTTIGTGASGTCTNGSVFVKLVGRDHRSRSQQELMVEARQKLGSMYGARVAVSLADAESGGGKPLQVNLRGPDVTVLQALSDTIYAAVRAMPGIVD